MKVTLFDYTGYGQFDPARYAAAKLIFTKSTRLLMSPNLLYDLINLLRDEEIDKELRLMSNTNPGSWEFIHFSFLIEDCTRAFTQQLQRTRTASYAQQTWRVLELSEMKYETGPSIKNNPLIKGAYDNTMTNAFQAYKFLVESGARTEDARGVLPMNALTNICMDINMRNFINMGWKRTSIRVQDEHERFIQLAIIEVEKVYPWFHIFYKNDRIQAMRDLQNMINDAKGLSSEERSAMWKKIDLLKSEL